MYQIVFPADRAGGGSANFFLASPERHHAGFKLWLSSGRSAVRNSRVMSRLHEDSVIPTGEGSSRLPALRPLAASLRSSPSSTLAAKRGCSALALAADPPYSRSSGIRSPHSARQPSPRPSDPDEIRADGSPPTPQVIFGRSTRSLASEAHCEVPQKAR